MAAWLLLLLIHHHHHHHHAFERPGVPLSTSRGASSTSPITTMLLLLRLHRPVIPTSSIRPAPEMPSWAASPSACRRLRIPSERRGTAPSRRASRSSSQACRFLAKITRGGVVVRRGRSGMGVVCFDGWRSMSVGWTGTREILAFLLGGVKLAFSERERERERFLFWVRVG